MTTSAAFSIVSPYSVRNVQRQACVRTGWTCPITPNSASGTLARLPNARISLLKQELEQLLLASLSKLTGSVLTEMPAPSAVVVERTRDSGHGEFTTNLALRLAKAARRRARTARGAQRAHARQRARAAPPHPRPPPGPGGAPPPPRAGGRPRRGAADDPPARAHRGGGSRGLAGSPATMAAASSRGL